MDKAFIGPSRHILFQTGELICFDVCISEAKREPRSFEAGQKIETSKARGKSKQSRLGGGPRNSLIELIAEGRRRPWLGASVGTAAVMP